jgi:hypothetical protein
MDGIFLHASWRSSGTWLWEKLRAQPGKMGFYEPLHEFLPDMTAKMMGVLGDDAWDSRHPTLSKPYFAEYNTLLKSNIFGVKRGVANASQRLSFDRFFLDADARHDQLYAYIKQLCDTAHAAGAIPVMKFARSQGRMPWFVKNFPNYTHALILRQPCSQFSSGWRCLVEDENAYFLATPFVVLERNLDNPIVRRLVGRFGLPVMPRALGSPVWRLKHWIRRVRTLDAKTMYQAALCLWLLNTARALPDATFVMDGDSPSAQMAALFGIEADNTARPAAAPASSRPPLHLADIRACHATAMAAMHDELDPSVRARINHWLEQAEFTAADQQITLTEFRRPAPAPSLLQRAAARLAA